jgi:hypothetical protein
VTDPTPPPVDPPVDDGGLVLPAGPDLSDLQAFTDNIPDEGHRAIAQQLVDAFTDRDAQLTAFLGAYTAAMGDIAALQATVTDLQAQITALTPVPVPDPIAP